VSLFYGAFFAIIGVYVIYLPKLLELSGYSATLIGILFAISPFVRFLIPFLPLVLTPSLYRKALILLGAGALATPWAIDSFWSFALANLALGIGFALSLPFVETIALKEIGKERYGRARLFGSIGFILVALVLAHFMDQPQILLISFILFALATIGAGWSLGTLNPQEPGKNRDPVSIRRHWPLWLNFFLMQVSFGPFYNFFTIYERAAGLSYTTISYLWSFGVVAEIVMLYFQGPLLRRNLLSLLHLSSAITAFRWLLLYLFPTNLPILFFAQSLHAFSFALYYSAAISYLFTLYTNKTLAQQLFGGISFGLGGMVGSSLAGLFYGKYLFAYAAFVAALATAVLLVPTFRHTTKKLIKKLLKF